MLAGDAGSGGVFTPVKTTWRQRACYFRRGTQHVFACGPCPPWTAAAARADAEPQTLCVTAKGAHVFYDGAVRPSAFAPRESLPLLDSKQTCSLCHGRRRLSPGPVAAPERQPAPLVVGDEARATPGATLGAPDRPAKRGSPARHARGTARLWGPSGPLGVPGLSRALSSTALHGKFHHLHGTAASRGCPCAW